MLQKFLTNLQIKVPHNVIDKKLQIASMYVANKNYHTCSYKILIAPNTCFQSMKFSKRHHFLLNQLKLNCLLVAALASPLVQFTTKNKNLDFNNSGSGTRRENCRSKTGAEMTRLRFHRVFSS